MGTSSPYKQNRSKTLQAQSQAFETSHIELAKLVREHNINPQRIAAMTVTQLVDKLNCYQISSFQIVVALAFRCCTVGREYCLITSFEFMEAVGKARYCDKIRKESGKRNWTIKDSGKQDQQSFLPPLFGIPISLKDTINIKNHASTVGLSSRTQPLDKSSPLVQCLIQSGAIPFTKSNIPQFCMSAQTNNLLWGRSLNPWNKNRAVGGSSGGEGGLIAAQCSVIGVGSDIGGSIRVPAQHCGVFGLKMSSGRLSNKSHTQLSKAVTGMSNIIPLCLGPLTKSSQDMILFLKTVTTQKFYNNKHDPYTKIIPFNTQKYLNTIKSIENIKNMSQNKVKIGLISEFTDIEICPTSRRAIKEVTDILRELGCEVEEIKIPNERQMIRQYLLQLNNSHGKLLRQLLKGQKPTPQNSQVLKIHQLNQPFLSLASFLSRLYLPRAYFYSFSKKLQSIFDYQKHIGQIQKQKEQFIQFYKAKKLNYIICPGFPIPAILHGQSNKMGYILAYTFIWNLLDMTVGAQPVTLVRDYEQKFQSRFQDGFIDEMRKNMEVSVGLPVGVQVIGLPYKQQEVLALMKVLQNKISFYKKYPLPNLIIRQKQRMPGQFTID